MKFLSDLADYLIQLDNKYGLYFENGVVNSLAYCCFMVLISFFIYKLIKRIINKKDPDNRKIIVKIWKIFIIIVLVFTCLNQFKPIQSLMQTLLASGGVLALVLSLAAQETLSNLIAGIMIVLSKPFCVGDLIKINNGEYIGYVEEITLRHTVIRTYEHNRITVPNSTMSKSSIENADLIDTKKANFLEISITYESDLDKAVKIMKQVCCKHPLAIDVRTKKDKDKGIPKVKIKLIEFEDSGIKLRAVVFSDDSINGFDMLSDLRFQIKKEFDKNGIEFAYPHMVVEQAKQIENIK